MQIKDIIEQNKEEIMKARKQMLFWQDCTDGSAELVFNNYWEYLKDLGITPTDVENYLKNL